MKSDDSELVQVQQAVKKTGRGGKYNFPQTIEPEDAEDVRAALSTCMKWFEIGKTKAVTDQDWDERTTLFFNECLTNGERPTWEKYCLAVGYPRQMVWDFMQGNRNATPARSDIIKRAKEYCACYDAEMVTTGKMRDTPYIFRAKNYYDMKDVQDITIEPKQQLAEGDAETIAAKWAELPENG